MKKTALLLAFFITAVSSQAQTQGPIGHWDFNGNANDISGNNMNGTVVGASLTTGYSGTPNTAYKFKGETVPGYTDHINIAYNAITDGPYYSICALVKADSFNSKNCQNSIIFWRGPEFQSNYYTLFISDGASNSCGVYDPAKVGFLSGHRDIDNYIPNSGRGPQGNYVQKDQWYCVVHTYDGSHITTYVDGALYHQMTFSQDPQPGNTPIRIGASLISNIGGDWKAYPFYGTIDDMKLYDRALTANEASAYCTAVKGGGDPQDPPVDPQDPPVVDPEFPAGVKDVNNTQSLNIYPNPANDHIQVSFTDKAVSGSIKLLNSIGQVITTKAITGNDTHIDMSSYASGMYMIKVESTGINTTRRFVKQ